MGNEFSINRRKMAITPLRSRTEGRFILYSDTSIEGTGSSLWQIQEGKPKLIGYASKTLSEACSRYSATELEMTGLLVNMNLWKNLLKHRDFDAAVDHAAVDHSNSNYESQNRASNYKNNEVIG